MLGFDDDYNKMINGNHTAGTEFINANSTPKVNYQCSLNAKKDGNNLGIEKCVMGKWRKLTVERIELVEYYK